MDEFFEAITLIQTRKILNFPIVLIGTEFFKPLLALLNSMIEEKMIDVSDLDLILVTDSIEEAVVHIEEHATNRFGLKLKKIPKPSRILGEV